MKIYQICLMFWFLVAFSTFSGVFLMNEHIVFCSRLSIGLKTWQLVWMKTLADKELAINTQLLHWFLCLHVCLFKLFFIYKTWIIFFVKFYFCNTWCSDIINACVFQTLLYTHIRLACLFSKYEARLQCVQARLQALAILGMYITFHSLL